MNLSQMLPDLEDVPDAVLDDVIYDSFLRWTTDKGITLYPAQEEASLGLLAESHVLLLTPTGSGKSMVANAAHFIALARGQRSFYTAPIKALVNEKFFSLCDIFGPDNVGMMTGDATVNAKAPIICATAEILANIALREGNNAPVDQVVMDEFHYYSDPDRGWAWQVPLLELTHAQFLLMSATLGDTTSLQRDLSLRTGRRTELVSSTTRPVPLSFSYVYTNIQETIEELLAQGEAPIYVVHFSQREAAERAQALTSITVADKDTKAHIAELLKDFRFSTSYGRQLSQLLRKGIGVHHAGMLPKYRRLVERLSQQGLLKVICGTDTLGVGINVPIRTVLFTSLAKFDGTRQRILSSREFHQIAGRAGRAGFDTKGTVIIQATPHEIENVRLRHKANSDPKKLKKLRKKTARDGEVVWSEKTFNRLVSAEPEPMKSQFRVTHSLLLNVLAHPEDAYDHLNRLLRDNHDSRDKQNKDILVTLEIFRGLHHAGLVERSDTLRDSHGRPTYHLLEELPRDFALNQPLAPFALAALTVLNPDSDTFTLDIISVFESILEDPRPLLLAQQKKARGEEIAALKDEGVDYTDRMALVEDITWPQPLSEELDQAFDIFCAGHPWAKEFDISPKSVLRDMIEKGMTFSDLISTYSVARSEGVILHYLTDAWRTLRQTVPEDYYTEELDDVVVWLGELIKQVDSSLMDEWAHFNDENAPISQDALDQERAFGGRNPSALTSNTPAFTRMVRNFFFRLVRLFAYEQEEELADLLSYLDDIPDFGAALDAYFDSYADLDLGADSRGPDYFILTRNPTSWTVQQIIKDPEGDNAFSFHGVVDLEASNAAGEVRLKSLDMSYS